jgi:predicted TPR repeat methyltransferase
MRTAGYANVTVTDAFDAAVEALKDRGFADAKKLNVLTDEPEGEYDLIFASAVFLHFTESEFETALQKLHSHLGTSGLLAFTVKEGDGEEWSEAKMDAPRFFHFWRGEPLRQTVQKCGYKVMDLTTNEEFGQKWLAVTAQPTEL